MRAVAASLALLAAAVLVPTSASAQEGAIAGRVLDVAGDPLPGVTVEVLGSAQGETRLEVTDREGRYRIDDLLPGAYAVWFTLLLFQWVVGDLDVDAGVVDSRRWPGCDGGRGDGHPHRVADEHLVAEDLYVSRVRREPRHDADDRRRGRSDAGCGVHGVAEPSRPRRHHAPD